MRFKRGDIVVTAASYKAACYAITNVDPSRPKNIYNGIDLSNRKSYMFPDESISLKVGEATAEFLANQGFGQEGTRNTSFDAVNYERGKQKAMRMARMGFADKAKWKYLASLEADTTITINAGRRTTTATFKYVLEKGEKYVFLAVEPGKKPLRYALSMLVVPGESQQKRSEKEILADFQIVTSGLSPETGDGELPRSVVMRRQQELLAERTKLIAELGREPSKAEIYADFVRF